jgi:arabinogalactan oligomer/maltooligosaccharide transport system substrate-binding protein
MSAQRPLQRRARVAGRIAAALAAALAVAPAAAAAADLVVWNPNRNEELTAFEKLVANYNARKGAAGPHVTLVHVPFDGFADRIAGAVPRGRGPDAFVYPQDRLGGWVEAGNIVTPIEGLVDTATRERFIPATVPALTYHNLLYGLPLSYKLITLCYNRKLVKTPPRTTAEMEALAKKLTDRSAGVYGLVYLAGDYWYQAALQNGFGGRVFDQAIRPVLDSPENVKALELLVRWKHDFMPEEELSYATLAALFNQGKAAMIFTGPWVLGEVDKSIDYAFAMLPNLSEANNQPIRPWMTVEGIYVAAPSKQKEAAYDFMKYATDLESAKLMALEGTQMPANQKVYLEPALALNSATNAFFRQARVAVAMPNVAEMTVMWSPVTVALGTALRGAATPKAALDKAQEQVAKAVAALHSAPRPPEPH